MFNKISLVAKWVEDPALSLLGSDCCCDTGLIPGLGIAICHGLGKKIFLIRILYPKMSEGRKKI